jgi:hypothetical protein
MECPTCRRTTSITSNNTQVVEKEAPSSSSYGIVAEGIRSLPKNFELLRVRHEMESNTQEHMNRLRQAWTQQVKEKEQLARLAQENAYQAQKESEIASQRAASLLKQVEINEQEKIQAQKSAEEAKQKAHQAFLKAKVLEQETLALKNKLEQEMSQVAQIQANAFDIQAKAQKLHTQNELLQAQVDSVKAQLSLHSGKHDPSRLVVLVMDPLTISSWTHIPFTRYAVVSITTSSKHPKKEQLLDFFLASKTWSFLHQVSDPACCFVKVYRRYNDFVWLHDALVRAYPNEIVPCLPKKQAAHAQMSDFLWKNTLKNKQHSKHFIIERMKFLQAFLHFVLRHEKLGYSELLRAFLLSTTEELEAIKRKNEADSYAQEAANQLEEVEAFGKSAMIEKGKAKTTSTNTSIENCTSSTVTTTTTTTSNATSATGWTTSSWNKVAKWTSSAAQKLVTSANDIVGMNTINTTIDQKTETGTKESVVDQIEEEKEKGSGLSDLNDLLKAYENVCRRGNLVARAERKTSYHLHRICEYLQQMDTCETKYTTTTSSSSSSSSMFSTWSMKSKSDAECFEYGLLEIIRMQFLYLTSVDKTFGKLKEKEEILFQQKHLANNAQTIAQNALNKSSNPLDEDVLSLKKKALKAKVLVEKKEKEIALAKQTLFDEMEKIASPLRSHFVLETLKKNTKEIQILSQEKQQMLYQSQQQIQQISPFSRMSNK